MDTDNPPPHKPTAPADPLVKLPVPERIWLLCWMVCLVSAVYVAADLEPDPRGFGTHQQLGLPECVFRQVSGFNCPHCGMTTSVSHLFRRNLKASVRANPMGLVIIPLMGVFVVAMFLSSVTGIRLKILQFENVLRVVVIFLLASILIWLLRTLHG